MKPGQLPRSSPKRFRVGLEYIGMAVVWPVVGVMAFLMPRPHWWGLIILVVATTSACWTVLFIPWWVTVGEAGITLGYLPFGLYRRRVPKGDSLIIIREPRRDKAPILAGPLRIELRSRSRILLPEPVSIRRAYLSGMPPIPHFDRGGREIAELAVALGYEVRVLNRDGSS